MNSRRWSTLTKSIVSATLAVLAIALLVTFRSMITPTIVAFLLAFVFGYPVNWIQSRTGLARGATVAILFLVLLLLIIVGSVFLYPRGGDLAYSLQAAILELVSDLQTADGGPILIIGDYELSVDSLLEQAGNAVQNVVISTGNPILIFRGLTTGVLTLFYVMVLTFWILKDLQRLQRVLIEQIPQEYQGEVRRLGRDLGGIWDAFLRGQVVLAIVVGFITWFVMSLLGMPNAGGLAILAAFMEFLPTIGPGISMFIATAIALFVGSEWAIFSNNFTFALIVLGVYNVITWLESAYLIPRLVGSCVRLHPAITFVGIISGAVVFGIIGVLLATPVMASVREIGTYLFRKLFDQDPFEPSGAAQTGPRIPGLIAGRKVEGLIFDLDGPILQLDFEAVDWIAQRTSWAAFLISKERRRRFAYRSMVRLESTFNFILSQLWRAERHDSLTRFQPLLDEMRGYAGTEQAVLQPDIVRTLQTLKLQYQLALVSTREEQAVKRILEQTGLGDEMFDVVVTRHDVRNILPSSESFVVAAERLGLDLDHVLVISDTDPMLGSGSAAGMAAAGVLCGLGEEQDIRSADIVVETTSELQEWL